MKKLQFTLLGIIISIVSFAQSTVKGKVYDAYTNKPLSGANIQTENGSGTSTDANGMFSLNCSENMSVTISFISYETYTVTVKNCNEELKIALIPSDHHLNEVEITATTNPNKQLLYQPMAIVKLSPVELQRGTGLYFDDAINGNVPGVTMQRRAVSSGQQFNIRGYGNGVGFKGANNNFDGQGYKVYLNGIPITDAEGVTLMDDIDFSSIGNVEVVKGPAGSLYGLAIAGAVNLKTIRPAAGKTSFGQTFMMGNYGTMRLTSQFTMGTEKSSFLVNYGHQLSDGYMDHTASRKDFVNFSYDYKTSEKQSFTTYFGYSHSYDQRGGELTIDQYDTLDYTGNPSYIKNNAHSEIYSIRAGVGHTYKIAKWLSNTTSFFVSGQTNNSSSAGGWTDKNPINFGTRSTLDFNFILNDNWKLNGTAGTELQQQNAQIIGYKMVTDPNDPNNYNVIGDTKSNQYAVSKTSTVFTEWTLTMPKDLSLTAGVGTASMLMRLQNRLYASGSTKPVQVDANYFGMVSPHVALNKVFNKKISAYVSYSKGYKAPVSGNIILSTTGDLNTGLVPEIGNQFEIGTKGNLMDNKLHYEIAVFDAIFSNKMTSVAVPLNSTTTGYTYIANGGTQNNKGVEVLVKWTAYSSDNGFFKTISPYANFTYSNFKYEDFKYQTLNSAKTDIVEANYSGLAVAGVAPYVANAGIDFNTKVGLYGNVNWNYRDAMPITSDGMYHTQAYNLLNAKIGFRKSIKAFDLDLYAGGTNLTNTHYYYMVFINQLPDAYLPAPLKAVVYAGVSLKYNF